MRDRLMSHLPEIYDEIAEFMEITDRSDEELEQLYAAVVRWLNDQFVLTSSERAVKRREQQLRIQADPTAETLDFRKKRIINRYSTKPPFTIRYLQERIDYLLGKNRAFVRVDPQNFILNITASIQDAGVFKEMEHTVMSIKPANLIYHQQTAVKDKLQLVEHIAKHDMTWNYKLDGTWRLGEQPFASLGPEVVIK
ncbi:putative phage tail protein [Paenibacillus sp. J2TS4]|uniref:putative phage tail protein n=1 Tax=Paenibacillus sp. J2TS4 TaxID=2807194 RepID=UPI001B000D8F|nr:putative phage tail protein [Paenibacillus sp. J2TS4]GIP35514.1 phage portal protein [Paenibacillus sp. J2TS4]